jgi:hypothetical protein
METEPCGNPDSINLLSARDTGRFDAAVDDYSSRREW